MSEDDLIDILAALESDDVESPPAYAEELWAEVRQTLERTAREPNTSLAPGEVVELARDDVRRSRPRPGRVAALVAAAAVLVIVGLSFGLSRTSVETDPTPVAATPRPTPTALTIVEPLSAADACASHLDRGVTTAALAEALESGTATRASFDDTRAALAELEQELRATGDFSASELAAFEVGAVVLDQALLEFEAGDTDAAIRTVSEARGRYGSFVLPAAPGEVVRRKCLPDG